MSSFPVCQVCHHSYCIEGPTPFLLPCLHAVCETCVTSAAGGVISCTTCQRDVNLTETQLQKDVVRQKEIFHLTVQHHPAQILCTHEDDSNQAVCWCKDCEDFLCENCHTQHESFKASKNHNVLDFSEIRPGCIDDEKYCKTHPKYPLEIFDKSCNMLICTRCRRGEHVDHSIEDFEDAAKSARTELTSLEKEVSNFFEKNRVEVATFQTELQSSSETCDILTAKISHTFQSLKSILDQHEKELLVDLNQHKEKMQVDLSGRTTVSELNQQRCRTTSDYISKSLLYSSHYDILNLMSTVERGIQEFLRDAQIEKHPKLPLPQFCDRGLDKLKLALSRFGSIVTDSGFWSDISISQDAGIQTEKTMANIADLEKKLKQSEESLSRSETLVRNLQEELRREKKEADRLRKEDETRLSQYKTQISQLQEAMTCLTSERDDMKKKLNQSEESLSRSQTLVRDLQVERQEDEIQFGQNKRRLQENVTRLTSERNRSQQIIAELQKHGIDLSMCILDRRVVLQRVNVEFDKTKFHEDKVHVTTDGHLVNQQDHRPVVEIDRFKKYEGTRSLIPLPKREFLQYFEVKTWVEIETTLTNDYLLLEIGLVREMEQDQYHFIGSRPHSYSLSVQRCPAHSSICRCVWKHGYVVLCRCNTLNNSPGTSSNLHYGIAYDHTNHKILFLDVGDMKVISVIADVDDSESLWPVFGVYNKAWAKVRMSLVVGRDINMSDEKQTLILDNLA